MAMAMTGGARKRERGESQPTLEEVREFIEKRLFVSRIPPGADEGDLHEIFDAYGAISECKVVPSPSKDSVGFVTYDKWAEAHRALIACDGNAYVKGRQISVSFAEIRSSGRGRGAGAHLAKGMTNSRVFISHLPRDCSEADLRSLCRPYGEVELVKLLPPKEKRCAFVTFSIWGEALDAIEALHQQVWPENEAGAVELSVVLAEPPKGGGNDGSGGDEKRRRIDDGRSGGAAAAATHLHQESRTRFEMLKEEYLEALDNRAVSPEECTRLHLAILDARRALGISAKPVIGASAAATSGPAMSIGGRRRWHLAACESERCGRLRARDLRVPGGARHRAALHRRPAEDVRCRRVGVAREAGHQHFSNAGPAVA
eukprot:TRINITY_DN7578_c1_g1_i2.p1 TRINITY_DN7578_c1_g1~~TRINITY_DN7578_c1_g1_i2.p1  ORF type:complete len:372 (-),score=86.22 TRINITY_DN7578_c1_g1_i2:696-1811(-)